ncbi:pleiotropic regulatory protein RsmS [Vibrio algarum]|uniref:Pleiotropic regulatory protein RsmS n=1 Tax=Vibrio algarum TaxID=3020714 RepID=A0ABT4YS07_9VIBR|nr:pleiotropic regulatory protein RsmS [Vibrio sp. KJ40-1]MDB1124343.1 pleiotropic regulatory protein RsmS [Vibrio sp. KJ40-1]
MTNKTPSPLDSAPDEIKLAVDLIYLLESNDVDPVTALNALDIVKQDMEKKVNNTVPK